MLNSSAWLFQYNWVRSSKRWINIALVEEVHVKLLHASVKKGVSVSGNAPASGPHVAESCKLGEEIIASVSLSPKSGYWRLGARILRRKKGVQDLISDSVHLVSISTQSNRVTGWALSRCWGGCCYQGKWGETGHGGAVVSTNASIGRLLDVNEADENMWPSSQLAWLFTTCASLFLEEDSKDNVTPHTHTRLILQRRCLCHARQRGLSINEQTEEQMSPFMLTVSRSQRTRSSFPAELWFGATETKPHSSAEIKRCFFTPTANERLPNRNWRQVCSWEFTHLTDDGRQWAGQLHPAQSSSCQLPPRVI